MFTAAITPAFRAAGATIARVAPVVLRFAGYRVIAHSVELRQLRGNKEIIDPFVDRQTASSSALDLIAGLFVSPHAARRAMRR